VIGWNGRRVTSRDPLRSLRWQLTSWYAITLAVILLMLGGGLYLTMRTLVQRGLDSSLHQSVDALMRAAQIREQEAASSSAGKVVDAVEELHIPERTLYLLDSTGHAIKPEVIPTWAQVAAADAGRLGETSAYHHEPGEMGRLVIYARRFRLQSGRTMVAAAVASDVELDDQYTSLIAAFSAAATVAVLLVVLGGWLLARKSTQPVEDSMDRMRRFIADAAHELRTPTAVIRTRADIALQQERRADAYASALLSISADAARLGHIIDDLLTLARADAGQRPVQRVPMYLDDVALDAAESLRPIAQKRNISMVIEEFDETVVEADPMLIHQLVVILLDNAIKYSPEGAAVRVSVTPREGRGELTITDNGSGIPADQFPRVFDRFFRGDPARSRTGLTGATEGAGLGLAIAKWIVDSHGASIELRSAVGTGTTAVVSMPLATAAVSAS
jgi:signal transduction histidine kinase